MELETDGDDFFTNLKEIPGFSEWSEFIYLFFKKIACSFRKRICTELSVAILETARQPWQYCRAFQGMKMVIIPYCFFWFLVLRDILHLNTEVQVG